MIVHASMITRLPYTIEREVLDPFSVGRAFYTSLSHAGQLEKGDHVDQRHSQWATSCKTSTVQFEARDKFVENFMTLR